MSPHTHPTRTPHAPKGQRTNGNGYLGGIHILHKHIFLTGFDFFDISWTLWDALGRFGTLWDALGRFGTLWDDLGRFGTLWDALGRFGT